MKIKLNEMSMNELMNIAIEKRHHIDEEKRKKGGELFAKFHNILHFIFIHGLF